MAVTVFLNGRAACVDPLDPAHLLVFLTLIAAELIGGTLCLIYGCVLMAPHVKGIRHHVFEKSTRPAGRCSNGKKEAL